MMTFEARERSWKETRSMPPCGSGPAVDNKALARLVLEAVRGVEEGELNPPVSANSTLAFQPRAMLTLLTYCYAIGVYGSQDVEEMMYADADFRAMFGMEYPDWRRLKSFRRHNTEILRRTLEETFKAIWRLQCDAAVGEPENGHEPGHVLDRQAPESSRSSLRIFDPESIADETQALLERAMFIDHMAMD